MGTKKPAELCQISFQFNSFNSALFTQNNIHGVSWGDDATCVLVLSIYTVIT